MSIRQVCRFKIVDGLLLNCSVTGSFVAQMCWFQMAFIFRTHLQRKPQILLNVSHKMYVKSAGTKVSPVVMLNNSSTKKIIKIQNSYMQYYIRDFVYTVLRKLNYEYHFMIIQSHQQILAINKRATHAPLHERRLTKWLVRWGKISDEWPLKSRITHGKLPVAQIHRKMAVENWWNWSITFENAEKSITLWFWRVAIMKFTYCTRCFFLCMSHNML